MVGSRWGLCNYRDGPEKNGLHWYYPVTAKKKGCVKSANYNVYRGEGTYEFISIFGDVVGPFDDPTGSASYKIIC